MEGRGIVPFFSAFDVIQCKKKILEVKHMTEKEMALKVSQLTELLREEYGIETREQFIEAYSKMKPIDISVFVRPLSRQADRA